MISIIPALFETDPKELERKILLVSPFTQWIHIDITDTFLQNAKIPTFFSFLKKHKNLCFEAHIIASKPETYVKQLIGSGFARISAQVECHDPREFLGEARSFECEAGLSLDIETLLEEVEPFLEELDSVTVMTSSAGAPGGLFEERSLSAIKAIHRNLPDLPIEAEGGINEETIKSVVDAGATRIISTSYIFKDEKNVGESIQKLSSIINS